MNPIKGIVLLCAHTARSVAYVQSLHNAGLVPAAVILYGEPAGMPQSYRNLSPRVLPWFCPDLSITVEQSVLNAGWKLFKVEERELDSEVLQRVITSLSPEVVVYSGYGGQLVPKSLLEQVPVLHIHSGLLPRYRGSTTLYHELLEHGGCAASAILLTPTIDTGPVLATRTYPMPPVNMDVDYLYDSLIRADLLLAVLHHYLHEGELPPPMFQEVQLPAYYIIHPLLKHLALKRVDSQKECL
ncbi:formyltransferase family protein [Aeromonas veronii]|uniref:formyltransferase family protein n=1 Tax=Aeromonas veronii TaxID=654 RepID=UPI001F292ACD|nr:formyltransferase family protein [Aeromonas veronii]